ncbi:hypothetical protein CCUS01_01660 [Colletotrichum cuscutae]|uniref:Uncharacterized protein n=1 Tax=Colletotrichum cuscutae TaxID=1209917 RepID=A0AAI9UF06_9PEZI|nr:hypothetical protein CCUS01_01660 [Colletotrichum cuscutae]
MALGGAEHRRGVAHVGLDAERKDESERGGSMHERMATLVFGVDGVAHFAPVGSKENFY